MPYTRRTPWAHRGGRPEGDDDINLRPPPRPPTHLILERYRLSTQFKRGHNLEDDDVEDNSFSMSSFTMGSSRRTKGRAKFLAGFGSPTDFELSNVAFNYSRRWIYVYAIPMEFNDTPPVFLPLEAEIPFEDIITGGIRALRIKGDDGMYTIRLTITTRRPARFYIRVKDKNIMRRATARDFVFSPSTKESTAGRSVEVMTQEGYIIHEGHAGPIPAISDDAFAVPVQAWLSWRFDVRLDAAGCARFRRKLLDLGVCGREDGQDLLGHHIGRVRTMPTVNMGHVDSSPVLSKRSFELRYLVEGLVSHGLVVPSEIPQLLRDLDSFCRSNEDLKTRVLTALFNEEHIDNLHGVVAVRSRQLRGRRLASDDNLVWVYRCVVTPTRVCLYPPEQTTSNEALRQHNMFRDRFLRVTFADESDRIQINPTVLSADEAVPYDGTLARVRRALQFGLQIAGRHYVFLAYGASSAREHSCWFVAEDRDNDFTAKSVGTKLGFGRITENNVAKHAARMGIPFSSTRPVNVQLNVLSDLPDLFYKTKQGEVCFTDGVGVCGKRVARQAAKAFGAEGVDANPSAIQIRCGGIKGVLGVWPMLYGDDDVRFRPSQIKFRTDPKTMQFGLNVVRTAQYRRAFLNRQFIIIMEHLGVRTAVFEELFLEAIIRTREIPQRMKDGRPSAHDLRLAKAMCNFALLDMLEAGFNRDPFFVDVVKVLETHQLHGLKWKNRLELENGVCLMGISDELGVLREGEVFCQYNNPAESEIGTKVVTGECAIMRAPSLHPGDIRTVTAVDYPELRHLCNVIVFSVRGKPLPDQLSGDDLDGDDYSLIWDKRLLPRRVVQAANYTPPQPFLVKKQVQQRHVQDFFINYIKNDILGQVSNAHLAHADRHVLGPGSPDCLELARQASLAVDFAKTGVPARMHPSLRPKMWPTFMGKDIANASRNNYESRQVLGVLFKLVHPNPEFKATDFRLVPAEDKFDKRLAIFKLPASLLDDAFKLKQDYDTSILGLMMRYRITEAEVVAGVILRNPQRRGGRDGDMKEAVEHNYRALREVVFDHARAWLEGKKFKASILQPLQMYAIAAYQVTYVDEVREAVEKRLGIKGVLAELVDDDDEEEGGGDGGSEEDGTDPYAGPAPLMSFPWVFMDQLCDLPNVRGSGPAVAPKPPKRAKEVVRETREPMIVPTQVRANRSQSGRNGTAQGNGHAAANGSTTNNAHSGTVPAGTYISDGWGKGHIKRASDDSAYGGW